MLTIQLQEHLEGFIDDLIAINNGNVFENYYSDFLQLILIKENTSHRETTF